MLPEYEIQLLDHSPVKLPPYKLMPPKMAVLRKHVQHMQNQGIIKTSTSKYSRPIFSVFKGKNGFCSVVDFRALNQKPKSNQFRCAIYILASIGSVQLKFSLVWV